MRALIQRVSTASVDIDGAHVSSIGQGFLIFLGVGTLDTQAEALRLWEKILKLRIFSDAQGKTNLSLRDVAGQVLVVSQFTLYANCRRGNRPSFTDAAGPAQACELYEYFCTLAEHDVGTDAVGRGVFGADMAVSLTNDGPFTIWLDTDEL